MTGVYVYMILCKNNTVYTGITDNMHRRYSQHKYGKGARYTRQHGVEKLLGYKLFPNRSAAMKEEYRIKNELTSGQKRELAASWSKFISFQ